LCEGDTGSSYNLPCMKCPLFICSMYWNTYFASWRLFATKQPYSACWWNWKLLFENCWSEFYVEL